MIFHQQNYLPWSNLPREPGVSPPPKPGRLPLSEGFLSYYMDYLHTRNDVSTEERWELQAMYNTAVQHNHIWASQVRIVTTKMEMVLAHISSLNSAEWVSAPYRQSLVDIYQLVYAPFVQPWSAWSRITDDIDSRASEMYPEEYSRLIDLIKLHGIEITNCRRVLEGQSPLPNPLAKTTATYDVLYEEITKAFKEKDAMLLAFVRKKLKLVELSGLISIREMDQLRRHAEEHSGDISASNLDLGCEINMPLRKMDLTKAESKVKSKTQDLLKEMTDRLGGVIIIHLAHRRTVVESREYIEGKGITVYDAYDYSDKVSVNDMHIQLMDTVSQFRCDDMAPQVYVVDKFSQLHNNILWNRLLDVSGCLVMDSDFNVADGRSVFVTI